MTLGLNGFYVRRLIRGPIVIETVRSRSKCTPKMQSKTNWILQFQFDFKSH